MNKILFKLIEGKGKFFLMRDVKVPALRMDELDANCHPELGMQLQYEWDLYHKAEDEALKNGEIVNPEVLNIDYEEMQESGHSLKDGDTFDLPEGMGFEKKCTRCGCTEPGMSDLLCCSTANYQKVLLILPEKPVPNYPKGGTEFKPITIEDIKAVRESIGASSGISEIKFVENQYFPDNLIMVSTNIYNQLKDSKL